MIRLLLFLLTALITQACEKSIERRYILENGTDYAIKINAYKRDFGKYPAFLKSYNIFLGQKGETWDTLYHDERGKVGANVALNADSLVIVFSNLKRKIYTLSNNTLESNLLYNKAYKQNKSTYTYTFTEEDYQKADSIQ